MTGAEPERAVLGGATRYLLRSARLVPGADLAAPTPCPDWDLGALLRHVRGSLAELAGVLAGGRTPAGPDDDPVAAIRDRTVDLLVAWVSPRPDDWCPIGDRRLPAAVVVHTAATEMVLHGWDIARACGAEHPIPGELARALLTASPVLAAAGDRAFATPLPAPATATPGERLLARYGRDGGAR